MSNKTGQLLRRERMEITLSDTIDLFVVTKATEGRSPKTTTWYRELLRTSVIILAIPD